LYYSYDLEIDSSLPSEKASSLLIGSDYFFPFEASKAESNLSLSDCSFLGGIIEFFDLLASLNSNSLIYLSFES